jgi:hypothetical protein
MSKMLTCKFCSKECKNNNSLKNHERLCPSNVDRIYINGMLGKKGSNQYIKARELGLSDPVMSDETRLKISIANNNRIWTDEQKTNQSIKMKATVKKYPESYSKSNVSGRTKLYDVIDSNGNPTKVKGTWELIVANYLTDNNIHWINDIEGFPYEWNGTRLYYPDFYCKDLDLYVEVKGYEIERDRCKWQVVPNLLVLRKEEVNQIQTNNFKGL